MSILSFWPHVRQERSERFKKLLQDEVPDAAAIAMELRSKALACAFDSEVSVDETLVCQAEEILSRKIDVPEAHLILMRCYRDGIILERNGTTSNFHLTEAARKGNHAARYLVASKEVELTDPKIRYLALASLIELALTGNYWKIKEEALWRAMLNVLNTLETSTLSPEDAQFMQFYQATFKGSDPGLLALMKDATANLMASNARMGLGEDAEAQTVQAESEKSEVEKWRQRSRAFLARHHDRITALGNSATENISPACAPKGKSASTPQKKEPQRMMPLSAPSIWSGKEMQARTESLNIPFRILAVTVCILLGFIFFPLFLVGGLIAWSIYSDIVEAPAQRMQKAEIDAWLNAPVGVKDIRVKCDSPAETAFLDAMVSAFNLQAGPGAVEGGGLRLRNQVGMGRLNVYSSYTSHQYRADFLIDEQLVVEIDGATYHSSPEAVARDRQRDADMRREGFSVLRIPAQVVFRDSVETVRRVENARAALWGN